MDSNESADGSLRYMLGGEPILSARQASDWVDAKGRPSYVTSAGSGPSVGRHLLMAYLPAGHAVEGTWPAGGVHGQAVPGHGGEGQRDPAV